jgi:hypothetical protein
MIVILIRLKKTKSQFYKIIGLKKKFLNKPKEEDLLK